MMKSSGSLTRAIGCSKSAERSATPAHRTGVADRKILDTANIVSHCNIDRLMAMYQASHPGVALTPRTRSQTFALGGDGPDDLSTPLYPFRRSNGVEWTSNDIKTAESIFATGYAYPEVPAGRSGESLRIFTTERANQLYGPNLQAASFVGNESGAAGMFPVSLTQYPYIVRPETNMLLSHQHQPPVANGPPTYWSTATSSRARSVSSSSLETRRRTTLSAWRASSPTKLRPLTTTASSTSASRLRTRSSTKTLLFGRKMRCRL